MTFAMTNESTPSTSWWRRVAAWLVHLFTASGAVFGLFALSAIHRQQFILAFWLMAATIIIDSVDGVLARRTMARVIAPQIDGALLDNIVDYLNYVIVPAFFLIESDMLPGVWRFVGAALVVLASAYQFTQYDAKTQDHFFKGFPSYWNIVVFYLFFWQTSPWTNLVTILILAALVFVPIKCVYPSRLEYLTHNRHLRRAMLLATFIWGGATASLIWLYPKTNRVLVVLSMGYMVLYILVSLYRTLVPLEEKVEE